MIFELDEPDLQLLNVLQISPRISWAEAGRVLETTPAVLAERWEALRASGAAWVTAHPGLDYRAVAVALVEIDCAPGATSEVVDRVSQDPRVVTVEETTRGQDLLLTVMTPDIDSMTQLTLDDLTAVPGVERQRTHVLTAIHHHGAHWRLGTLTPDQQRRVAEVSAAGPESAGQSPSPEVWPLVEALVMNGRYTAADVARVTGRNPATVRRQLGRLRSSGWLSFRCEVAQGAARLPVSCTWLGRVAAADHTRTVAAIKTMPELRLCASTTGETNMLVTVWTRSTREILQLEKLLGERLPAFQVAASTLNLRTPKRMGWLLDGQGRATGEVVPPQVLRP